MSKIRSELGVYHLDEVVQVDFDRSTLKPGYRHRLTLLQRWRAAWNVFLGRAQAIWWPDGLEVASLHSTAKMFLVQNVIDPKSNEPYPFLQSDEMNEVDDLRVATHLAEENMDEVEALVQAELADDRNDLSSTELNTTQSAVLSSLLETAILAEKMQSLGLLIDMAIDENIEYEMRTKLTECRFCGKEVFMPCRSSREMEEVALNPNSNRSNDCYAALQEIGGGELGLDYVRLNRNEQQHRFH